MAATFAGDEDNSTLQIATEIVAFAATRVADHSFIYMEVLEENSLRTSFDINLYPAMLPLNAIRPALTRLRDHFSIPGDAFGQLCHLTRNKLLGHLSGGISRDREEFLSIYYEN
jgi:hypothetical protein